MRVLLCGGGSAGHVNPAIAIGETVLRNSPQSQIAYVTTEKGIENKLVNYRKYTINIKGLKKNLSPSNIKTAFLVLEAIKKSKQIINEFSPDIIVGTGGYATYPVIYAGHKMGIKTALHESNVVPGKTIKLLQGKADVIFTNFSESIDFFRKKEKILHVGNPLRHGFNSYNKNYVKGELGIEEKYVVLCYGGSLGAEKINMSAISVIENFIKYQKDIRFILATGGREYHSVMQIIKQKGLEKIKNVTIVDYIYDMPKKMAIADIVVSRAGAMTISELAASKKCSILIPSPNVANNHQFKNAQALGKSDAAVVITEDKSYLLTEVLKDLLSDKKRRDIMAENINKFYLPNANRDIFVAINELIYR
ncbi:MAG: UDP-N-acetylglucosamine--N-acetylmuramyl-(pentapeptide) pyrophosphoryl-undecaprenol N-acetylglucosamine transferase [Ruminococcaceae bacterium]|nr:UDP-N-acetylglucosamine--N-acetylmuramyl-(pentapeptide) pyrophosphoryl-undecaprenol N-acetylglucosamine transferase [Oscillospiraceae bacterium]